MNVPAPLDTAPIYPPVPQARPRRSRSVLVFWLRAFAVLVGLYLVTVAVLGAWWSWQPERFDVKAVALERVGGDPDRLVPGTVAVAAVARIAETLLDKPGGWVTNDAFPPGIFMDNMPSWEQGALKEVRDSVRALRNDFSRSQSQSVENAHLRTADSFLSYDTHSWILPSTEDEYRQGIAALDAYLEDLIRGEPGARFFARADNFAAYLSVVEKRLGSFAQRLSASVGDSELVAALVSNTGNPDADASMRVRTPWLEVDNVFFEARGYTWALLHNFKALAVELQPVLQAKNAEVSMAQVIRDLQDASVRMWSPVVLNGSGFGLVANHSLSLASYISRANAAVIDLRILLQQG